MNERVSSETTAAGPPRVSVGPAQTTVVATWRGGRRYAVGKPGGPTATIDGAGEAGPGPVDTMLGALAACGAIDVEAYLVKRRTPPAKLEVIVAGERRGEIPRRVVRARLEFHIEGVSIDPDHAKRAVSLAVESYCSVASSLAPDIVLETSVILNGALLGEPERVYPTAMPVPAP